MLLLSRTQLANCLPACLQVVALLDWKGREPFLFECSSSCVDRQPGKPSWNRPSSLASWLDRMPLMAIMPPPSSPTGSHSKAELGCAVLLRSFSVEWMGSILYEYRRDYKSFAAPLIHS